MKTSEPCQQTFWSETELPLTQSVGGSPAKTLAMLESVLALKVKGLVCGESTGDLLARYDPASSSWRTSQACLVSGWEPFSETFPRSGMMLSGTVYQLPPSAPLTGGTGSGSWPSPQARDYRSVTGREHLQRDNPFQNLNVAAVYSTMWPTPTTRDWKDGSAQACQNVPANGLLGRVVHQFATPQARDYRTGSTERWENPERSRNLNDQVGGSLSADWVEALMGFPIGWTFISEKQ